MIDERSSRDERARLSTLHSFDVLDAPDSALLDRITRLAALLFDVPMAAVALMDASKLHIKSGFGLTAAELPREIAFCDYTIGREDVFVIPDTTLDARFYDNPLVLSSDPIRFYAGAPLIAPNGAKLGTICLLDRVPRALDAAQRELLVQLSKLVVAHFTLYRDNLASVAAANALHAIIRSSPFAIVTSQADGIVTLWNDTAERMFGWTSDEAVGSSSPIMPPELEAEAAAVRARVASGEFVRQLRTYRRHKSGARIDIDLTGAPVRDAAGTIVQGVYILEDVTEHIRERALERARYEILEIAANDGPLQELLDRLVANVELAIPGSVATIVRIRDGRLYHAAAGALISERYVAQIDGTCIGPTVGSCGAAAFFNATVISEDIATDPNWAMMREAMLGMDLRACWSVPIRIATGVIGTMATYVRTSRGPTELELRALSEAAHVASIVLEGHDTRERLRELAMRDALTDLPNRTMFEARLRDAIADAKRTGAYIGVGLLDLDRFKVINDNLGHAVGDQLLQEVASRLSHALRPEDTVARMGGDEFLILIANTGRPEDAREIASRCLASLRQSFAPGGHELFVRASLGISVYPDDALEPSQLLRLADRAMYEAKAAGTSIVSYDASRVSDGLTQLTLETQLNRALENDEFVLEYQPIVHLPQGSTFAAEALIRWNHPELGLLGPERFIALAEDTGLIISIGAWLLREACRFSKRWSLAGGCGRIAVNVSPRQFEDKSFVATVMSAVREAGIDAHNLYLEITEGLIMRSPQSVAATLADLRRSGIRSLIDDFGSGYSSLSFLKRFRIEAIKIDRSFVSEIGVGHGSASDEAIISAIVAIGKTLGQSVIAEGVETQAQADFLRTAGCRLAQGYLYARAMPADDFLTWRLA